MSDETKRRFARGTAGVLAVSAAMIVGVVLVTTANGSADVVVPAAPSVAADGTPPETCVVTRGDGNLSEWASERAMDEVSALLDEEFGTSIKKQTPHIKLENGLIGLTLDFAAHEIVLVADPGRIGPDLRRKLDAVADDERARNPSSDLRIRVQAGCHTSSELLAAVKIIDARDWHPDVAKASYGGGLDVNTSTWRFSFDRDDVGAALKARLGDLVRVSHGGAHR